MPLIKSKSKQAFGKNVATEMDAGKPQDQSLAIAYSVQRNKKKKYAKGGMIPEQDSMAKDKAMAPLEPSSARPMYAAKGGIAESIRMKRKMMAEGGIMEKDEDYPADGDGRADVEENAVEKPNSYYKMDEDAADSESYAESEPLHDMDYPDANQDGHTLSDEDAHDMVSMIRAKLRKAMS